jgi:uncharacterized delta-60 repeat protein
MVFVLALILALALPAAGAQGASWLDPSFGSGGVVTPAPPPEASEKRAGIVDLALAPDGMTVGSLGGLSGSGYFGAVRLTPAGEPDPAFGQGGFTAPLSIGPGGFNPEAQAEAVAVQGDGKIVVAGLVQEGVRHPTSFSPLLARYLADGSLDPSFGAGGVVAPRRPSGWEEIVFHGVDLAPDGRIIVVAGRGEHFRSIPRPAGIVFAFNPDGTLDKSFGRAGRVLFSQPDPRAYSSLRDVEVLDNGRILVAGYHDYRLFLARLHIDGRPDRGFGGGDGRATLSVNNGGTCCPPAALTVQADGRIVLAANGGPFRKPRVYLVRYRPGGGLDRGFGNRGVAAPFRPWRLTRAIDVAIQANGGILTVGQSDKTKQSPEVGAYAVFRNNPDGSVDRSFGSQGLLVFPQGDLGYAGAALAQSDGGVLTGGSFVTVDPGSKRYVTTLLLARFLG